jgi:ornithine decarboxylase
MLQGVYNSFNCIIFDHSIVEGRALFPVISSDADVRAEGWTSSVWGPTCDSMDCVSKDAPLPLLAEGDWLYYRNMGAYTKAASSGFNGFQPPEMYYTYSVDKQNLEQLLPTGFPHRETWISSASQLV